MVREIFIYAKIARFAQLRYEILHNMRRRRIKKKGINLINFGSFGTRKYNYIKRGSYIRAKDRILKRLDFMIIRFYI